MILTGIKDGDFEKGKNQPLSSDPNSPHYDPEWKSILQKHAPDIIEMLAVTVFDTSLSVSQELETDGEDEADADPF
jgi:hypothetical protein